MNYILTTALIAVAVYFGAGELGNTLNGVFGGLNSSLSVIAEIK